MEPKIDEKEKSPAETVLQEVQSQQNKGRNDVVDKAEIVVGKSK